MTPTAEDTCRPGDPDPTFAPVFRADESPGLCRHRVRCYVCTRDAHAAGQHVAGTSEVVAAVWTTEDDVSECWCEFKNGRRLIVDDCPEHGLGE